MEATSGGGLSRGDVGGGGVTRTKTLGWERAEPRAASCSVPRRSDIAAR